MLQIGLEYEPKNKILLKDKYNRFIERFENCFHEVPWIVLYGFIESASVDDTITLEKDLETFISFCKEHNFEIPTVKINRYQFYIKTWKEYLNEHDVKQIDYETFLSTKYLEQWIAVMRSELDASNTNKNQQYLDKYL